MAAPMKQSQTSFQKKIPTKLQIPGTKPSLYNNQLLISTGIPSLDNVIGGGLAVGTVLLIEEDVFGGYGRLMLKYFCAEAVMTGQALFLGSMDNMPSQILNELPAPILDDPGPDSEQLVTMDTERMKIAWRYQHLPQFQSSPVGTKFGHYYDLTRSMELEVISSINTLLIGQSELTETGSSEHPMNPYYLQLLKRIQEKIESDGFGTAVQQEKRNILRIAIHSLGSPLWGENGGLNQNGNYDPSLPRFLLALRVLMRSAFAVCVITMPTHLFCDEGFVVRVERLCDTVVHLESFAGSEKEKNSLYKEYHGLFNIRQLPSLNSLTCHMPDTLDLAFKLRRKRFSIEKLHLPPELSETASRPQEDPLSNFKSPSQTGSCGTSLGFKNKLDF
ncbi:hypothetical protein ACJMK2_020028 [Sinanodonta woodiana]|uniref:Elongator complex protein 4 n=1 Tax=Sinanodonta woodiana TaxID=1069815 RepID=A0ABD3TZH2_SINWO